MKAICLLEAYSDSHRQRSQVMIMVEHYNVELITWLTNPYHLLSSCTISMKCGSFIPHIVGFSLSLIMSTPMRYNKSLHQRSQLQNNTPSLEKVWYHQKIEFHDEVKAQTYSISLNLPSGDSRHMIQEKSLGLLSFSINCERVHWVS